jgi:hypothetical protein
VDAGENNVAPKPDINDKNRTEASPKQTPASPQNQNPEISRIQAIVEKARRGQTEVLPELEKLLTEKPKIWAEMYDLSALVEQAWINQIAGKDLFVQRCIRRRIGKMKADLAGPTASALEHLLANRIAVCWLVSQASELVESADGSGIKVTEVKMKQSESANRRLLSAAKALAAVRRLENGLKIQINHTTGAPVPSATAVAPVGGRLSPESGRVAEAGGEESARGRIREFFDDAAAVDNGLIAAGKV